MKVLNESPFTIHFKINVNNTQTNIKMDAASPHSFVQHKYIGTKARLLIRSFAHVFLLIKLYTVLKYDHVAISVPLVSYGSRRQANAARTAKTPYTVTAPASDT